MGGARRRSGRRADGFLGVLITLVFLGIAVYQALAAHQIDKYIIGALLVFGLGSLGWRLDLLLERWIQIRNSVPVPGDDSDDDGGDGNP